MIQALLAGVASFLVACLLGEPIVGFLGRRKVGKAISVEGPTSHSVKAGTPTMGGILVLGTILVATFAFDLASHPMILLLLCVIVATAALGLIDDRGSLLGRPENSLSWRLKFELIGLLSLAAGMAMYRWLKIDAVAIPWYGRLTLGVWIIPLALPIVVGTTSAVAITDGLDGLLGGTTALAFIAYGVIANAQQDQALAVFCFIVVGACLGFLWYNAHPARVFMGDTGALALGATLAIVAMMTEQWLLLPVIGIVFVATALSDIMQIVYFKLTHGRRLFRMAPLHHHFELLGWPEPRIVTRFWLIGAAGAMLGIAAALKV